MKQKLLYLFTRTPLHVGAGASVGAIDQPVQRERHTGFPIIPASSLKGSFADQWEANLTQGDKKFLRVTTKKNDKDEDVVDEAKDSAWLFGSNNDKAAFTGALQFGEARLLAFPIRSAKGSFAWITCPLMLRRAARDEVLTDAQGLPLTIDTNALTHVEIQTGDENALLAAIGPLALRPPGQAGETKVVLEEYTFTQKGELPAGLGEALQRLLPTDEVWKEVATRLVILSDGMMSFFAQNACEVAQHVKISDETGTAERGALFNQENVPSETLFYSVIRFFPGRGEKFKGKTPDEAVTEFTTKLASKVFQFGGDASTGLGYCTVKIS